MKKLNLRKDQIQKLLLSTIGFIVLLYVYFNFFLGPLNRNRAAMLVSIADLQGKLGTSKDEITKASNLERQASTATERHAALTSLSPEGAPIAWFPPRMKVFFANREIEKTVARLETNVPYKDAALSNWAQYNWLIDLPQTDFSTLGKAIAELENSEPLLSIKRITIHASGDNPQFQQVALNVATAMLKR